LSEIVEPSIVKRFLNPTENLILKDLLSNLELINSMMIYLQREDISLADARNCFDAILVDFPELKKYLQPDAEIIIRLISPRL
jgi:hypothetical protein